MKTRAVIIAVLFGIAFALVLTDKNQGVYGRTLFPCPPWCSK